MLNIREMSAESAVVVPAAPVDLKHLIIKLRWMGMEGDALKLHRILASIAPGECAALWPMDTD
jgi:hypothetical protein